MDTQDITQLVLWHDGCRRARKSQGYKAGELQPHYLIQLKCKSVAVCQEIGLVAVMFFFELLFSYVLHSQFHSMLFFLILSLTHSTLICFLSKILKVKTIKMMVYW